MRQRLLILKFLGLNTTGKVFIESGVRIKRPDLSNISIGDRSFINHDCFLENGGAITIGNNVCIAPRVTILTTTHEIGPSNRRAGHTYRMPVVIGDGCWIGARTTILPGVKIGEGVVIAAGAVVTDDCLPDCLYAGVPARIKKTAKETKNPRKASGA